MNAKFVVGSTRLRVWYIRRRDWGRLWRRLNAGLADLARNPPSDPAAARAHYGRASSILRQALRHIVQRPIETLPSTDLAAAVAASPGCQQMASELGAILAAIDEVRFSGGVALAPQHADTLQRAMRALQAVESVARFQRSRNGK